MVKLRLILALAAAAGLWAAEHSGVVRSGGLPIPGATVTARLRQQEFVTYTDETGRYVFPDLPPGVWKIEAAMRGFQTAQREVTIAASPSTVDFDLKLNPAPEAPLRPTAAAGAAFQQLALTETVRQEVNAALAGPPPELHEEQIQNANESFLVSGSLSRGLQDASREDPFFMHREEFRERLEALRASGAFPGGPGEAGPEQPGGPSMGGRMGGGPPMMGRGPEGMPGGPPGMGGGPRGRPGGPGGGGGRGPGIGRGSGYERKGGPPGRPGSLVFGNRARAGREPVHGGGSFSLGNSAFDARPYSISGQDIRKPSYAQSRFSLALGGPLRLPKLIDDERTFFFANYFGTRSRNPFDAISTMPSLLEREGDFSQSVAGGRVVIFDPLSGAPFPANLIPAARHSNAARGLLELIPLPNQPGNVQNYQIIAGIPQNSDNFGVRLNRGLGRRDRLSGGFNIQRRDAAALQLYGFRDTNSGQGLSVNIGWIHTIRTGFLTNLRVSFSRNTNETVPFFAYGRDWARELGIRGTSSDPRNYGPPNLAFTNFGALTDANPSLRRDQSSSVAGSLLRVWKRHNFSFGGEYRRSQINSLSQQNARGSMTFTGLATSALDERGMPLAGTGFDFADFLLGRPQSSSIRFGNADTYFRGTTAAAHFQDDWRVRSNLTINAGLRYELMRPLTEKYGRMANLDIAPGFSAAAVVTPGAAGPFTGLFPNALVETDGNNIGPRIGIAWRPFSNRTFQVRAGYGWYYNGPVSNQAAFRLAQQPPFAQSATLNTTATRPLTIESGFATIPTDKITNSYAVDRYYRTGYAQTWNLAIQQELPAALVIELGYLGTKGTRLDIQRIPNRAPPGSPLTAEDRRLIANAVGFTFDSSEGNSIYHAAQVRVTRRFRQGMSANALYTFGKSIDNASSFGGGGGVVVAQNDRDLRAERGLSSFDRRHTLNLFYVFTTSSGRPRGGPGVLEHVLLRNWTLSGGVTIRAGGPFTAQILGNRADQAGTGAVGSSRADATGLPVRASAGFFNLAAFAIPPAGRFGNAGRNTIPGPGFFSMNMSLGRAIQLGESRRGLDLRLEASNLLNSVNITRIGTTVNSRNYGLPLAASQMRRLQVNLRFRF